MLWADRIYVKAETLFLQLRQNLQPTKSVGVTKIWMSGKPAHRTKGLDEKHLTCDVCDKISFTKQHMWRRKIHSAINATTRNVAWSSATCLAFTVGWKNATTQLVTAKLLKTMTYQCLNLWRSFAMLKCARTKLYIVRIQGIVSRARRSLTQKHRVASQDAIAALRGVPRKTNLCRSGTDHAEAAWSRWKIFVYAKTEFFLTTQLHVQGWHMSRQTMLFSSNKNAKSN